MQSHSNGAGWRLASLTLGNLVVATGVTVVVGILPELAHGLDVSPAVAGQLGTAYAVTACLLGPFLGGWTSRFDRRSLLLAVLLANAVANLASAIAPGFWWLMACRVLAAAVGVLHTSQAAVTASMMVPPERRGRAMALVFLGVAMSSVIGLPLGAWLGHAWGWRSTFVALGVLGCVAAALEARAVPRGLRVQPLGRASWGALWRHPVLLRVLGVSVLQYGGQATLFGYLAVSYQWAVGADAQTISLLLGLFGACAIVGNVVAGRLLDRVQPATVQVVSILGLASGFLLWKLAEGSLAVMVLATVTWGLVSFVTNSAQQVRLVALAAGLAPVTVALNTSCIMLGQALGTALGGAGLARHGPGVLPWLGLPLFACALVLSVHAQRRAERLPQNQAEPAA